jgi:hypothetical protein
MCSARIEGGYRVRPRGAAFVVACLVVFACGDSGERGGGACARYTGIAKRETITQSPFPELGSRDEMRGFSGT